LGLFLAGTAGQSRADILVRADGTMSDGNVISQSAKEVVFQPDGADAKDVQHIDRATVTRVLVTDEHGALLSENGATPRPSPHGSVPPEPAAPPVVRPTPGKPAYYLIPLHGEVGDTVLASALEKSLADAALRKPTVVVLDIDSPGGLVEEAQKIIKVIHHYNKQLRIVALTDKDLSAAAILSLAVKEIYVKSTSTIGAATSFQPTNLQLPPKIEEKMQSAWRAVARNSAEEGGHEPLLAEAMIDNDIELHLESANGKTVVKEGPGERLLCRKGKILTLSSHEAVECGLAAGDADDVSELGAELKMPAWAECKGLGTLLADYLPKKAEVLKAQTTATMSRFQQHVQNAKESDPAEVISRVVTTGPRYPRPMVPGPVMPGRPRPFRPGFPPNPGGTTVVTTVSRAHWKARSLACTVALQQAEADLAEEKSLCEAFGQQGAAELFGEAQTQLGVVRARIYDDRDKYGPGIAVAVAPPTTRPAGATTPANPPARPPLASRIRDNRMPTGAVQTELLGGHGGGRFVHVNPTGGPVVGFRYALGSWGGKSVMRTFDPIYDRPTVGAPADPTAVVARDGYVVGALRVESDDASVFNVQVVFVRFTDGRADPADSYTSERIGVPAGAAMHDLGEKGTWVIGTYGRKGLNLDALGLVLAPKPAAGQ
jgi:ATP-dependent protease ClpP protease subunit